jgi:hypothetical protein
MYLQSSKKERYFILSSYYYWYVWRYQDNTATLNATTDKQIL